MAKSIQTNFSLRLADSSKPKLIGDEQIASALTGKHFYSKTYTVDYVGVYLGVLNEFLAIKCKTPVLIQFQRVDMDKPTEIYCNDLFINHGDFGKVWLKVPSKSLTSIVTVWYGTNAEIIEENEYVDVQKSGERRIRQLALRNLNGIELGLPILKDKVFVGLNKLNGGIQAITHNGTVKSLPVHIKK